MSRRRRAARSGKHHANRPSQTGVPSREHELETIKLINLAIEDPTDLTKLRKVASVRGLVNHQLRSQCWQLLVGAEHFTVDPARYADCCQLPHRDSRTVDVDVDRSLWTFMPGCQPEELTARRQELSRVLNAVVNWHTDAQAGVQKVHYYQGLHDVASVLVCVVGERAAFAILNQLVVGHLRDATRSDLDAVLQLLNLINPILEAADPELHDAVQQASVPPFFALSWYITWFAHDVKDLAAAARLFDLFLSSHPLMPLYLGVAAMCTQKRELLQCTDMPEWHTALRNLDITKKCSVDSLAAQAIKLFKEVPPQQLLIRLGRGLGSCVAPAAELRDGRWYVPPEPVSNSRWTSSRNGGPLALARLMAAKGPAAVVKPQGKVWRTALSVTGLFSMSVLAVLVAYGVNRGQLAGHGVAGAWASGGRL